MNEELETCEGREPAQVDLAPELAPASTMATMTSGRLWTVWDQCQSALIEGLTQPS